MTVIQTVSPCFTMVMEGLAGGINPFHEQVPESVRKLAILRGLASSASVFSGLVPVVCDKKTDQTCDVDS